MAVSLKHNKTSTKADGTNTDLVQPSDWNAEHTLTLDEGKVLGRAASAGNGAAQELPLSVGTDGTVVVSTNTSTSAVLITQTGAGPALVVEDSTNPDSTPFVVSGDGAIVVGSAGGVLNVNPANGVEITAQMQVVGSNTPTSMIAATTYNTSFSTVIAPTISLGRSNTVTAGGDGIVSSGDLLGTIQFHGNDGATQVRAAFIQSYVDATPGTNDMPGRLVFSTTPDGASSPTERMRIDSSGNVGIGTNSPSAKLDVAGNVAVTGTGRRFGGDTSNATVANRLLFQDTTANSLTSFGVIPNGTATDTFVQLFNGSDPDNSTILSAFVSATRAGISSSKVGTGSYLPLIVTVGGSDRVAVTTDGNVGVGTNSPASKIDLNGGFAQNVVAVAASAIDCSLGNVFTKTASGALTWTFTNVPASRTFTVILELTNGGTGTQTWPAAVKWPAGTAPTLTAAGVDVIGFITDDGGTNWRGVLLMKDSK